MTANTSSHPADTLTTRSSPPACYHCGENCSDELVQFDDKPFCCQGCRMVYEILQSNDMCQFYEIEEKAGVSLKGRKLEQYAWLDDAEVASKILDFNDGRIARVAFHLPQIHCASCIWLLENLYKLAPGIRDSKVNFLRKEAAITYNPNETSLRKIVELLASIGYAPELNMATLEKGERKAYNRRLIYQLGVAGFAFGNIMLLSFPEYLGLSEEEATFRQLFGYINILLALPVFLGMLLLSLNLSPNLSLSPSQNQNLSRSQNLSPNLSQSRNLRTFLRMKTMMTVTNSIWVTKTKFLKMMTCLMAG